LPAFAATLQARHAATDWKVVLEKTAEMMMALGANNTLKIADFAAITAPVLILLGDRDKMINLDETLTVYSAIPGASMGVLPNTQHPIEQADMALLSFMLGRFFGQ